MKKKTLKEKTIEDAERDFIIWNNLFFRHLEVAVPSFRTRKNIKNKMSKDVRVLVERAYEIGYSLRPAMGNAYFLDMEEIDMDGKADWWESKKDV